MDSKIITNDPLDNFSFDDLEKELNTEKIIGDIYPDNATIKNLYEFTIKQKYGRLSNRKKAPLFALVDWRGNVLYDLRYWKDDGNPSKGITFTEEELQKLYNALKEFDFETIYDEPIRQCKTENSNIIFLYMVAKLSTKYKRNNAWQKEVNLIDWGCGVKVDFRKWTLDYKQHSKGIRINLDELKSLKLLLKLLFKEE